MNDSLTFFLFTHTYKIIQNSSQWYFNQIFDLFYNNFMLKKNAAHVCPIFYTIYILSSFIYTINAKKKSGARLYHVRTI